MLRPTLKPNDFLVAESPAMRAVVGAVDAFAASDAPVLVCGEHGTGRELVARVLHYKSPRRDGRFIAVRPNFESSDVSGGGGSGGDDDADQRTRRALRAAQGGT